MAIDRDALLKWSFPDVHQTYSARDTMLYALGLGFGSDPLDPAQLRFVYEDGLQALPTMVVTMGYPGFWLSDPRIGADWTRLLHGEQSIEIFRPLPVAGSVIGRTRVTDVVDKGLGKGALVYSEREIVEAVSGELLSRQAATIFLRGDGGCGGPAGPARPPQPIPERPADCEVSFRTLSQAALIYRLSGDYNPLHADPAIARAGGFDRPILHGLCTFGVAGWAVLAGAAEGDALRIRSLQARFSAPVYPGETLVTELWIERDGVVAFRTWASERGTLVLNNGRALLHTGTRLPGD